MLTVTQTEFESELNDLLNLAATARAAEIDARCCQTQRDYMACHKAMEQQQEAYAAFMQNWAGRIE